MRVFPAIFVSCLALGSARVHTPSASAQAAPAAAPRAEDADARRAFEAGRDAYDHGAFAEAVAHYERAYALSARPGLLFNIARAADSDGQAHRARIAYEAYLEAVPAAENADFVRARLIKVRESEAAQAAAALPAPVAQPIAPPPAPEPAPPEPAAPAEAAPAALPTVAAATPLEAGAADPALLAQPRRNDDTSHDARPSRRKRALLWTALGVLVAGGVTGGAVALTRRGPERAAGDAYFVAKEGP